jgi:CubicO group peptidase (beta-lactamase class C family)
MEKQIASLFEDYTARHDFSGAGLIKRGGTVLFSKACGWAHRGFQVANTVETMFDTASVTKLFTAAAILQLADRGSLRLGDKITQLIDLQGTRIPDDVTVTHLLTHTSGIADDADEEAGEAYEDLFIDNPNYSIRNNIDFLPQFAYKEPLFKAGTAVRYNNCAFVLLGLAIEKVSGCGYQQYVTKEIFEKCGMRHSAFSAKDDADAKIAEGYFIHEKDDGAQPVWRKNIYSYPPVGTADGGAYSSVGDLDVFIRALKDGTLLSEEMSEAMFKPQTRLEKLYEWGKVMSGFGCHFFFDTDGRLIRMYKDGQNAGVAAMAAYYPDIDTTSIILANQDCNVWELHRKAEQIIFSGS